MPGLASLSKSLVTRLNERKASVCLGELDAGDVPLQEYIAFQYFPESITDTKAVNYATKDIPGGSLPLYQWTSSGERIISFQAVFTSDVDLGLDPSLFAQIVSKGHVRRNVDIRTALLWLRTYMLPTYGQTVEVGVPLTQSPRKLDLYIPNSGIGLLGGASQNMGTLGERRAALQGYSVTTSSSDASTNISADHVLCLMTQCDVTYEAFFPSGMPRIATVQLQFAQTAQAGGRVNFPRNAPQLRDLVMKGDSNLSIYPYPMRVKATFK